MCFFLPFEASLSSFVAFPPHAIGSVSGCCFLLCADKVTPDLDQNTITVMGYPPVNGFDQDTVLAIVKRRDPQATLLSFSELI